jgi:hypothetical protein
VRVSWNWERRARVEERRVVIWAILAGGGFVGMLLGCFVGCGLFGRLVCEGLDWMLGGGNLFF